MIYWSSKVCSHQTVARQSSGSRQAVIRCNVRSETRTVVVVVMLADYLPGMQKMHLITLIIIIGIVNLCQDSPVGFAIGLI